MPLNRSVALANRPAGWPTPDDFQLVSAEAPSPGDGECLIQVLYLSVDPYMRGRMRDSKSYAEPLGLGEVMTGGAVGRVVESRAGEFKPGDIVVGQLGWQEYAVAPAAELRRVDSQLAPISTALGVLGMPGLTAYFGLLDICDPQPGETVVVSGGAGAVGSVVGQIAKIRGCRAVGIAGSDEKIRWMTDELGFDSAINYKTAPSMSDALREACPSGVDAYFDNVGGDITDAVFPLFNVCARISICGQISQYNLDKPELGPRILWHFIVKRLKAQGFLVFDYAERYEEGLTQLGAWISEGKIRYRETVTEGLENAPEAFISMMRGANIGKQVVRVAPE